MIDNDDIELVQGSGNIFRDLNVSDANVYQAKAILSAQIIQILNAKELSVRSAETLTGIDHADFSRIRSSKLERFTIDRLIRVLEKLDADIEVNISVKPQNAA